MSASLFRQATAVPSRTRIPQPSSSVRTVSYLSSSRQPLPRSPIALANRPNLISSPLLSSRSSVLAASGAAASAHPYGPSARHFSWTPWKTSPPTTTPSGTPDVPLPSATPADELATTSTSTSSSTPTTVADAAPTVDLTSAPAPVDTPSLLSSLSADGTTPTLAELINNSGLPLDQVLNSPEAIHAAMSVSDLKLLGLQHYWFSLSGYVETALVACHSATGLPWWATIAAVTIGIRLCLFPLVVRNMKHNTRLQAVSPQMQALMLRMKEAKTAGDSGAMQITSQHLQKLLKDNDVNPFRPFLMPMLQLPFFLGMFYALRALADAPLPQLKEGGFGWVTDLTMSDPYCILPITSMALSLAVLRVGVDGTSATASSSSARTMGHVRNAILLSSPLSVWLLSSFPSAMLFYWTFTNLFTLFQALLLRSDVARVVLRIPKPAAPPPPPPGTPVIDPNPSIKESIQAVRDHFSNTMGEVRKRQAEQMEAKIRTERAQGRRGVSAVTQRINEPAPTAEEGQSEQTQAQAQVPEAQGQVQASAASASAAAGASFLESPAAAASTTPVVSREAAKRRRVEAAREKRARR